MAVKAIGSCPFCGNTEFEFNFGILKCLKCGEENLTIDNIELRIVNEPNEIELNTICIMGHGEDDDD
mgnify:CR=1 FL=1